MDFDYSVLQNKVTISRIFKKARKTINKNMWHKLAFASFVFLFLLCVVASITLTFSNSSLDAKLDVFYKIALLLCILFIISIVFIIKSITSLKNDTIAEFARINNIHLIQNVKHMHDGLLFNVGTE